MTLIAGVRACFQCACPVKLGCQNPDCIAMYMVDAFMVLDQFNSAPEDEEKIAAMLAFDGISPMHARALRAAIRMNAFLDTVLFSKAK